MAVVSLSIRGIFRISFRGGDISLLLHPSLSLHASVIDADKNGLWRLICLLRTSDLFTSALEFDFPLSSLPFGAVRSQCMIIIYMLKSEILNFLSYAFLCIYICILSLVWPLGGLNRHSF